jgi:hypothetical protein
LIAGDRSTRLGLAGGLAVAVLLATALRLYFVLTPHGILDADEAIVGLMGRHILRGEFPTFYYGQRYMGALEPNLAALGFAVAGASPITLKLVCLVTSLLLVGLTMELARRALGLGPAIVAGLLMAVPPLFMTVWSVKARGGFIETLVLGTVVLLLAQRMVEADGTRRLRVALVLGLVGGLAWWTCQLIVSYLAAAVVLIVRGAGWRAGLRALPIAATTFLLGSLPLWLADWLGELGAKPVWDAAPPVTAAAQLVNTLTIGLPALLGPGSFWPSAPAIEALTAPLLAIYALAWLSLGWTRVRARRRGTPEGARETGATLDAIVTLPALTILACGLSSSGASVSEPRYLLPAAAAMPLVLAAWLSGLWRLGWRGTAAALVVALLGMNIAGHFLAPWTWAPVAPASLDEVAAFFEARRIPVVATSYWVGPRLSFESGERVIGVSMRNAPERHPPYSALARRADRFAYAFLRGTDDIGVVATKLGDLGVQYARTPVGGMVVFHDLRLPGLDAPPSGLFFETLERLPPLDARLRIAAAYEAAGQSARAIPYLETALAAGTPAGSAAIDRLLALYGASGPARKAVDLAAHRAAVFTPAEARDVRFGEVVRLSGYTLSARTVPAGDPLDLVLFWSTHRDLDVDLYLGVQLTGGEDARQPGTFGPITGGYGTTAWLPDEVVRGAHRVPLPRDLRPGRYALRIRLWEPEGVETDLRPRVSGTTSRWLTLTEIQVTSPLP